MDTNTLQPLLYFNLYAFPPFISSLTALFAGLKVSNTKNSKLGHIFLGWCICVFVWLFSYSICYSTTDESLAILLSEFACTGALFFATTFYHFILTFLNRKDELLFVSFGYLINFLMIPATFTTNLILNGVQKTFFGFYVVAGSFYWILLIIFFSFSLRAFFLLIITIRAKTLPPEEHTKAEYFLFSICIVYFSALDFLPKFGIMFYPFGSIIVFIWILVMTHIVLKEKLPNIEITLRRWLACAVSIGLFIILDVGVITYQHFGK